MSICLVVFTFEGGSLGTETEVDNEDDIDASLHIMLDYGSDDLSNSVAEFKETLSDSIQNLKAFIEAYGDSVEIDDVSNTSINCTLAVADCPIDIEVEILPSLSWDVENGRSRYHYTMQLHMHQALWFPHFVYIKNWNGLRSQS